MTQKKKLWIVVACIAILLVGTMSTLAYFADQEKATNTFTVGKVYIDLDEADVDDSTPDAERDQRNEYHLMPGHSYIKDPTVHVLPDSNDCYVYVTVDNQIANIEAADEKVADQIAANGWILLKDSNNVQVKKENIDVYVYKDIVLKSADKVTLPVFESFKIDGESVVNGTGIDTAITKYIGNYNGKSIVVKAYAIQAAGFNDAFHAWDSAFSN